MLNELKDLINLMFLLSRRNDFYGYEDTMVTLKFKTGMLEKQLNGLTWEEIKEMTLKN